MKEKFEITETIMGFVFAINSLAEFIASVGLEHFLENKFLSRRTLLVLGCFL